MLADEILTPNLVLRYNPHALDEDCPLELEHNVIWQRFDLPFLATGLHRGMESYFQGFPPASLPPQQPMPCFITVDPPSMLEVVMSAVLLSADEGDHIEYYVKHLGADYFNFSRHFSEAQKQVIYQLLAKLSFEEITRRLEQP